MKLVKFPQGDNEVLIDPEKVSHIKKEIAPEHYIDKLAGKIIVSVLFGAANIWVEFCGKDAEIVWDYFYKHGLAKPATLD